MNLKNEINKNNTAENISRLIYQFLIEQNIEGKVNEKIKELLEIGQLDLVNEYKNSVQTII